VRSGTSSASVSPSSRGSTPWKSSRQKRRAFKTRHALRLSDPCVVSVPAASSAAMIASSVLHSGRDAHASRSESSLRT
jgi:hypothetical protein